MLSPYRIHPNNTNKRVKKGKNANFDNNSHRDYDLKRPQMTSKDLEGPQSTSNEIGKNLGTKNNMKCGFVQENVEINEQHLDEIVHNNYL